MTLNFVSHGDGTPVLALHGWTPDHRLMTGCLEPIFTELPGYRRLYPDLPGMGKSPAGDIDSSDGIMAALREFIDEQIGDEPFLLIGESYGGYLARGLVAADPGRITGLALVCPMIVAEHALRDVDDPPAA
jgi:pimeloyl-ACP methyl ester carboxylesterase